jgi:hypothetical protein
MTLLFACAILYDLVTHSEMLDLGGSDAVVADIERIVGLEAVCDMTSRTRDVVLLVVVMVEIHQLFAMRELVQNATLFRADPRR